MCDTKLTVPFSLFYMVTDFSAGALPIEVKLYTAVWPHLRQVFSHFDGDSPRDGRILDVIRGAYAGICFLLMHLLIFDILALWRSGLIVLSMFDATVLTRYLCLMWLY